MSSDPVRLLILGRPRSGTTLLANLLNSHDRVTVLADFLSAPLIQAQALGGFRRPLSARERNVALSRFKYDLRLGTHRLAIKPQEIALDSPEFGPGTQQYRASDGQLKERPDLFAWVFAGAVKNLNGEYAMRDVVFRLRLFSCPDFVTGDLDLSALDVRCNKIGDRRLGLYDLDIAPGGSKSFRENVTFDNQPAPGNWRHRVDVLSATARIE